MYLIAKTLGDVCHFLLGGYPYRWWPEDRVFPHNKHLIAFGTEVEAANFLDCAREEMIDGFFVDAVVFKVGWNTDQVNS